MPYLENMPSTAAVFSAYTTLMALVTLLETMAREVKRIASQFIPQPLRDKISSYLTKHFGRNPSSTLTFDIDEFKGHFLNEIYEASEIYLSTIATTHSAQRLMVGRSQEEKNLSVTIGRDQEIIDVFEGIQLTWIFKCTKATDAHCERTGRSERMYFELSFHKDHKEIVLNSYLPNVETQSKSVTERNKSVKIHEYGGGRGPIKLDHPSTFKTLAMDLELKEKLIGDLDRFVERGEFYRKVGKAWKRGYLLYGPPGTGKSSLIAAMANYLNFDIYDLDLSHLKTNLALRRLLVSTANRSIIVIEDIDCNVQLHNRQPGGKNNHGDNQLTLSGLLNSIDGLWSTCGEARIIVFTTNHKERLDPALLRPGRMDMHIHMSYCTPSVFRQLASNYNYLDINNHDLFGDIEELISEVDVTPAEVAEELLKSNDATSTLNGLIELLKMKKKKKERNESHAEGGQENDGQDNIIQG